MKTKSIILTSLLSLVLFAACEKSLLPDRTYVADGARVLFFNLSPDAPEMNLYFSGVRVTTQQSTVVGKLRGIPFRSSYPGTITQSPVATTIPTPYIGAEYFIATPGATAIIAKDTVFVAPTTFFTTNFTFVKDKYYSIFATDPKAAMAPVIIEDNIVPFETVKKTKLRLVNMLAGVAGNKVDLWMVHQPGLTSWAMAPYKLATGLDYKAATLFTDTISALNYKLIVTKAGAVPTANTAPATVALPYTFTFAAADVVLLATSSSSFGERTTYSLLLFGQIGGTGIKAPFLSSFRNRLK